MRTGFINVDFSDNGSPANGVCKLFRLKLASVVVDYNLCLAKIVDSFLSVIITFSRIIVILSKGILVARA